jgi:aminopeptidase
VHAEIRVPRTRWVILHYPTPAMAQLASMSSPAFEDFFYRVCTADYGRMSEAMNPLKALMESTDKVRITGPDTDLQFSIRGMPAVKCDGDRNIPDGELFTAPRLDTVEGEIRFNTRTIYQGTVFNNIQLRFDGGRAIHAEADNNGRFNRILDTDEGARRVGEFSLSFNPHITRPMLDILFDEKIAGALHLALGSAYDDADNGNRSGIHWDLIQIQTPEAGGGQIWFDGTLVRDNGRFVLPELEGLNPENLE